MLLPDGTTLIHEGRPYDPVKAHEYYLRTRKLKGRKKGSAKTASETRPVVKVDNSAAKARRRQELAARISALEEKLKKVEELIRKKLREEKSDDRKARAEKNRAAKKAAKPDSAAEKAKKAREAKKFRDQIQQKLKSQA